ncbi:oligosaccharide flippase family protein [Mesorhizobium sp. AR10]|uniref:oligosaccharide flippase family protein n=1 Tax=Mesorhizobium sp. AR10 TaxID=2865839 RepID=UPI00215E0E89|nr:oligosaccharide flippase family protein [Mesorhizobium sp. AR10]UVK40244.1 oligosaccharide flippase family protein [Mesorhizobium sp. AR10]
MKLIWQLLRGEGLFTRVMRSSMWATSGYSASQIIRLASNLILTRLLFPEAFGLMALVSVCMTGLAMFSDLGIGASIMQSKRGDDPDFLNTAWTVQVARGLCLWLAMCILAWPVASFYGQPILLQLLPVAGLTLLIGGFNPTRVETANRHLQLGRVILLDLISQVVGIAATIGLAWATQTVWGLAIGGVVGTAARLALMHWFLAGAINRFHWKRRDAHELIHFGKWIFFSTIFGFMLAQGDRAILGKYIDIEMLGIYNVGYFLASAPLLLGGAVTGRILIPLYRELPSILTQGKIGRIRLMRSGLTGGILFLQFGMAFAGVALVGLLYDPRYSIAGPIAVIISVIQIPLIIGLTYDQAALAAGDSKNYFYAIAIRAVVQTTSFIIGAELAGLPGAMIGHCVATVMLHAVTIWLARKYNVWDPLHDAAYAIVGIVLSGAVLYLNQSSIISLF